MRDLPPELRPRERLLADGPAALSDAELVAILLGSGRPGKTALELAQQLLAERGGLRYLAEAQPEELLQEPGLGQAAVARLKASIELGRRLAIRRAGKRPSVTSPRDVADLLMEEMRYLDREHLRAISLNTRNEVLAVDVISVGGLSSAPVHPRELFKNPLKRGAAAVILVHNHPSGDPLPSADDVQVTRRLAEAGELLGIHMLDHVIIGDNRHVSMKEEGLF